jgi:hypothetical protein
LFRPGDGPVIVITAQQQFISIKKFGQRIQLIAASAAGLGH